MRGVVRRAGPRAREALIRGARVVIAGAVSVAVAVPAAAAPKATPAGTAASATASDATGGATSPALEVTRRVQTRYDATSTFEAGFAQEMRLEAGGQTLRSRGTVKFGRPGRMRWVYVEPEAQEIIADGETLWIYQPEDRQALKAPLRAAFESKTPVSFLLGVARIEQDFVPTLLPKGDDGSLRLRLVPKNDPGGSLGSLTLDLDPVTFDIRVATIRDSLGNSTRVALEDLRRNQPIDDGQFRFDPPKGTDVVESPQR